MNENARVRAFLVAGTHRSGASALTRALSLCGLALPHTAMPPTADNPDGSWESSPVCEFNERVLRHVESRYDDPFAATSDSFANLGAGLHDEAAAIARAEFAFDRDFVLKDPRLSLLFPLWRDALIDAEIRLVIAVRNPLEVAASLAKRQRFPLTQSVLLWFAHLATIERDSRGAHRVFVAYDDLLSDWRATLRRIERKLDVALPLWTPAAEHRIDTFLSEDRRHHRISTDSLAARTDLPSCILPAYEWARAAAQSDAEPDVALLEALAGDFHHAARRWAPQTALRSDAADLRAAIARTDTTSESRLTPIAAQSDEVSAELLSVVQKLSARLVAFTARHDEWAAALTASLSRLEANVIARDALARQNQELAQRTRDLARERDQARASAAQHAAEAEAYRTSSSWRITAPVRVLARIRWQSVRFAKRNARRVLLAVRRRLNPISHNADPAEVSETNEPQLFAGKREGRLPRAPAPQRNASAVGTALFEQFFANAAERSADYVPITEEPAPRPSRIRAIAFYLPQFHPIPENDSWWGKGFTEWTNVSKAVPQFVGHHQPRLPDELGFYDLRLPDVQRRQVELAKLYGLGGFCFHYYWFSGRKRLLERPLNQYLAMRDLDFPFCICWANENWTRRWDGDEQDILMEQRHLPEDDYQFIEDLAPTLSDPRYIRIDGRPLIIVYRIDILPDAKRTTEIWRAYCRDNALPEPYLVAAQGFGDFDPTKIGFDAAVEFPPNNIGATQTTAQQTLLNPNYQGVTYSYRDVVERAAKPRQTSYPLFRTVFPSWDNEARKPGCAHAFPDADPRTYERWLTEMCRQADQRSNPSERVVFINAWNEWAEGAYLEPDRRYGYAYLRATRSALSKFQDSRPALPIGDTHKSPALPLYAVVHAFYPDVFEEILGYLAALGVTFRLIATCPPERSADIRTAFVRSGLACQFDVFEHENRGRDVLPFLEAVRASHIPDDAVILKLHTKKSSHRGDGADWRRDMYERLTGPQTARKALAQFSADPALGLVAPANFLTPITTYLGSNREHLDRLLARGGWRAIDSENDVFAAGTMFYVRRAALQPILDLGLTCEDFEPETGQVDGTLAHALERLFVLTCLRGDFGVTDTHGVGTTGAWKHNANFKFASPSD